MYNKIGILFDAFVVKLLGVKDIDNNSKFHNICNVAFRMRKVIIIIIISTIIIFILTIWIKKNVYCSKEDYTHEDEINTLKKDYLVDIIFYGKDFFDEKLLSREINELNEDTIYSQNTDYIFLIINDLDSNIVLSREDILFLKKQLKKNLNIYYLGNSKINEFIENNLINSNYPGTENGIAFLHCYGENVIIRQLFTSNDMYNIIEIKANLIHSFLYDVILQSN